MSDIEQRLLGKVTTAEGMATVIEEKLSPEVLEDPLCNNAFRLALEHWEKYGVHPTEEVLQTKFPRLKIENDPEDTTGWLVEALQKRHIFNRLQDSVVVGLTANRPSEDPIGAARTLMASLGEMLDDAGKAGKEGPRIWNALDLKPAEQPRWLAKGRLPRGEPCLLIGDEGVGKSLFWIWLVAHITAGTEFPGFGIPARDPEVVVVVCTEDAWPTQVRPRLEVAGADLKMVKVVCTEDDGSGTPIFPSDIRLFDALDPISALIVVDAWLDTVPTKVQVRDPQQSRESQRGSGPSCQHVQDPQQAALPPNP